MTARRNEAPPPSQGNVHVARTKGPREVVSVAATEITFSSRSNSVSTRVSVSSPSSRDAPSVASAFPAAAAAASGGALARGGTAISTVSVTVDPASRNRPGRVRQLAAPDLDMAQGTSGASIDANARGVTIGAFDRRAM